MKVPLYLILALALLAGCTTTHQPSVQTSTYATLPDGEFTFNTERVNITNPDVTNILNRMPGGSANAAQKLTYGYKIILKKEELQVDLPYFGRLYSPSYDTAHNGFSFTSKKFLVHQSYTKKGNLLFSIQLQDQPNVKFITIEIYKNCNAYVYVDASDRQPISYDGYITKNDATALP